MRNHIGRLNADGTVDPTFNPGANSIVQTIALQPDGGILIGGNFTSVGGGTGLQTVRNHIARLNPDGSVDPNFNPGANQNVYALVLQPDGMILVGGEFSTIGNGGMGTTTRNRLARLTSAGAVDSFNPGASKTPAGASAIVYTMVLQPDGKVVVGGYFNGLGNGTGATVRNYLGRINADGTVDAGFNPGASSSVDALALQADGDIVVGGDFTGLGLGTGAILRANIGRIDTDGVVDIGFNPGAEAQVNSLEVQVDGKIVAGGYFKWVGAAGGAKPLGPQLHRPDRSQRPRRPDLQSGCGQRRQRGGHSGRRRDHHRRHPVERRRPAGQRRPDDAQPDRPVRGDRRGGSDADLHRRRQPADQRGVGAQRRRAGSVARDVRVLVRRLVLFGDRRRDACRRRMGTEQCREPAADADGVVPRAGLLRKRVPERFRLDRRDSPGLRRRHCRR